jgi:hypothetical protein
MISKSILFYVMKELENFQNDHKEVVVAFGRQPLVLCMCNVCSRTITTHETNGTTSSKSLQSALPRLRKRGTPQKELYFLATRCCYSISHDVATEVSANFSDIPSPSIANGSVHPDRIGGSLGQSPLPCVSVLSGLVLNATPYPNSM